MKSGYDENNLCKLCKKGRTQDGHDPCIANLPGVLFACCGHGIDTGNIVFVDGRNLEFIPVEMTLDKPAERLVVKTPTYPMFKSGEMYRVLKFKTGKTKTIISTMTAVMNDRQIGWEPNKGE